MKVAVFACHPLAEQHSCATRMRMRLRREVLEIRAERAHSLYEDTDA